VILWLALRRLLPLLAVLSLALTPVAAPAAVAGMHAPMAQADQAPVLHEHGPAMASMDMAAMDAMPCCPPEAAAPTDHPADGAKGCVKGCPLMALCLSSLASLPPSGIGLPVPLATGTAAFARRAEGFASLTGTPPPEPPRA